MFFEGNSFSKAVVQFRSISALEHRHLTQQTPTSGKAAKEVALPKPLGSRVGTVTIAVEGTSGGL